MKHILSKKKKKKVKIQVDVSKDHALNNSGPGPLIHSNMLQLKNKIIESFSLSITSVNMQSRENCRFGHIY